MGKPTNRLLKQVSAYRVAFAIGGTMIAAAAAAATAGYLAIFVLPVSMVLGGVALWTIQGSRSARVSVAAGCVATLLLIALAAFYSRNGGNWNQPGTQWLLLPLLAVIMVLTANAFALYVRFVEGRIASLAGGPALVAIAGAMFWWLLDVAAGRADLYVYRLMVVFASLYAVVTAFLVADRRWPDPRNKKGRV